MKYFAKLKVYRSKEPLHQTVVPVPAANEAAAKELVERMVQYWVNIKSYEITKISESPIKLIKYVLEARIKYYSGKSNTIKFNIDAEDEQEAQLIFKEITQGWGIAREILKIIKHR